MGYKSSRRKGKPVGQDLEITPIMNLFMVIVPFLLLTVAFAKTAVLDLYLPQESTAKSDSSPGDTPPEILTIKVTKNGFELADIGEGVVISGSIDDLNYKELTQELVKIKDKYPQTSEAIILFEPDIPYEIVIKVMDASRETTEGDKRELFPFVSVGEVEREQ